MKPPKPPASPPAIAAAAARAGGEWSQVGVFALVLGATLLAYLPCLRGDFLWDDAGHVTSPALQSWSGLPRIWFEPGVTQQYYPLLHSAFWLEHRLWGDATLGYHLINVLWHATSACLLVAILRRLALPGALLAGLIFALHPVGVESVAWISEQKNTLSTVFALAATLAWLKWQRLPAAEVAPASGRPSSILPAGSRRYYFTALVLFLCALFTKTVTATLPGALLVLAWWQRGRLTLRRDILPLLPWFALSLVAGAGTSWFERTQIGAAGGDFALGLVERSLLAGRIGWFYLGKLLWPAGLTFFYPRWTIDSTVAWQWLFPAATLTVLAAGAWWSRRSAGVPPASPVDTGETPALRSMERSRGPLAATLLFGGTLVPVLGFVNVYPFVFSYVADHFQYLASLGMIAFLAAAATRGFAHLAWPRWTGPATAGGLLLLLGGLTWRQSAMYRDVFSLYETTLARNPSSWVAHLNLGTALDDANRPDEALPHLQRALELKPDFPETLNSLGNVLNRLGRSAEARPLLEQAVQIQPRFAAAHNTLGVALMTLGQADAGIASFQRALAINPNLTLARGNLGWALTNGGRFAEAVAQFEQAGHLQPDSAELEFKWAIALALNARTAEAVPHFARAVELQPDAAAMRYALGRALLEAGRSTEAVEQLEETLRLDPNHAEARDTLRRLQPRNE